MTKKLFMISMLIFSSFCIAKSPDLSQMTEEEKQLTGLNKLSTEELNALGDWIKNKQAMIDREIRKRNAGFESRRIESNRSDIKGRLSKTYNDKLGNTFYELDNGQIWKRTSSGSVFIKKGGRNLVTIEPMSFGSYSLRVDGNRSVKVKRIK